MHNLAKTYTCRPSDLLGLSNSADALAFDSACSVFGNKLEAELDSVPGKKEKQRAAQRDAILRKYIPELAKARKFADPGKR